MFIRIDTDLSVNINNIFSYKISEDFNSYKLSIWSATGALVHSVIYLKDRQDQMNILIQFNDTMRDLTVNPEIIRTEVVEVPEEVTEANE